MRIEILDSTVAGNWHVTLTTERGDIRVLQSVVPFSIPLVVESVEPSTGLKVEGGDLLTIIGRHFDSSATVLLDGQTSCKVTQVTPTQI